MSETSEEVKFSLRVLIDREKNKVLFAEVDNHFADTLISFLTLPLGTIVRLLVKHYGDETLVIGSLNTLYKGLENLDVSNFWTEGDKLMRLKPRNPFEVQVQKLKINIDDTERTKFFICEDRRCPYGKGSLSVNMYYNTGICSCGKAMKREEMLRSTDSNKDDKGVFTTETALCVLTDDLQLMPNSAGLVLRILNNHGITKACKVEEKTVLFGFEEIMDLLKGSLISMTPLTDLIFGKTQKASLSASSEFGIFIGKNATNSNSKKMNLKVLVQKSTGKIILAQTNEDFVDFLFSFLTIPLAGVLSLLEDDSSFGSILHFYKSRACLNSNKYLKIGNPFEKTYLPLKHLSKYSIYPVFEYSTPPLCYRNGSWGIVYLYSNWPCGQPVLLKNPNDHGSCFRGPALFSVTDDLVVKPMSTISVLSILDNLQIPIDDIEEHVTDIGVEEALSILKASLFSTSALNNGLKPLLMK